MKTMDLFVSLNNFNNQAEYEEYEALPPIEKAEDDFGISDVLVMTVGYSKVVIMTLDNYEAKARKTVLDRKIKTGSAHWSARSIAVNGKAIVMHGPEFVPFTVVPVDNEDGFEIVYRKGEEDAE
jgi:hypothetical protein